MEKLASSVLDSIKQVTDENPTLVTNLLIGGGAGALGGALLTGSSDDPDETAGSRTLRRIKNALIGAGLGAGGAGLLSYGTDKMTHALPVDDVDPATQAWNSDLTRVLGAVGAGSTAGFVTHRNATHRAQDLLSRLVPKSKAVKDPIYTLNQLVNNSKNTTGSQINIIDILKKDTGGNGAAISKLLSDAGVTTKGLDKAIDLQGLIPGTTALENKTLPANAPKILQQGKKGATALARFLQNSGGRALARNKYVAAATLAGLALPEVGSTALDYIGRLLGDHHE